MLRPLYRKLSIVIGCALLGLLLLWNTIFYKCSSTLLPLTEEYIAESHCTITGENVILPRNALASYLADAPDNYNPTYYEKYHCMLNKGKLWYILPPEVCFELLLSGSDEATVRENWAELKYVTMRVARDGSYEGRIESF